MCVMCCLTDTVETINTGFPLLGPRFDPLCGHAVAKSDTMFVSDF